MLGKLFGMGASTLVKNVGNASLKIRTALTGEMPPETRVRLEEINADLQETIIKGQSELNIIDAAKGLFFSGWRPLIGWVCAGGLATYFLPKHILGAYVWVSTYMASGEIGAYPVDADGILELAMALLGLGILRTVDKRLRTNNRH